MKAALFLATLLFSVSAALSQAADPLKTKALSFNINGLTLSGLNGGLGGKIWIPGNRAVTGSVDGGYSSHVSDLSDSVYIEDRTKSWNIVINAGIEQHFNWQPGLSPYVLGGVFLGRESWRRRSGFVTDPEVLYFDKNFSGGVKAGFGLEYWVTPRVSVSGQQQVIATYTWGRYNRPGLMNDQEQSSFGLDLGTSSVILSVYF
jgi:hypothetical protein